MLETQFVTSLFAEAYDVERELGRGGMATVFLAREKKHERRVVLKILRPELAAPVGAERFLREIRIAAQLSHPRMLPLIDSGEAEGHLYYVAPYMEEGSLRDRLTTRGRLDVGESLQIAEQIGSALDFAHRHGFVHRDVKPENILFSDGQCLLSDFGIARALCPDCEQLTEVGMALGTPAYMSPEQAAGEAELGPASDIYSLGCVVYEMLAGSPPFTSNSVRSVIAHHIVDRPAPIRSHRPDVPAALEQALARALAKQPDQRFATAADFVRASQHEPLAPRVSNATRSIAVLPFVSGSGELENEYLADGITEELINTLARVAQLRVIPRSTAFSLKGKPQDPRSVGALLNVAYVLDGTVRKSGSRVRISAQLTSAESGQLVWAERFDRELRDVFDVQDEIAHTIVATLLAAPLAAVAAPPRTPRTSSTGAYRCYLRGRYEWNKRTAEAITEAIRWFERAVAEDPKYAPAYAGLADSYALHVDYRSVPVAEGYERAKDYARKALELDDTLAEAHASLAWALFIYDWNWEEAEREFQRAIELDTHYAPAHQWYAFLLVALERVEEALIEGHTAVELDPGAAIVRRGLGWLYFYARRYDQAREHLTRSIEMNPTAAETYRVLGLTLSVQGDLEEAERVLREAVELPDAGTYTLATLAYVLARRGDIGEARRIRESLNERAATEYVSPLAFLAVAIGLNEWDAVFDWMQQAIAERRGWMAYLRVHPVLDPVRGDPRFERLLLEMKLA
ncbi:MAG TPA: protein kinase [Gemmatimonadaceae bacterium]|nr:protein kinase [Gemmatimonadaceae bacterium]